MAIYDTTQLLSRGASLKILTVMLKKAEEENRDLLEALKEAAAAIYRASDYMPDAEADIANGDAYKDAIAVIKHVEGIDPDYENAEAQREAN